VKIQGSNISLASSYQSMVREQSRERLQLFSRGQPDPSSQAVANAAPRSAVAISAAAREALAADLKAAAEAASQPAAVDNSSPASAINQAFDDAENDPVVSLLKSLLEKMTGEAIRLFSSRDMQSSAQAVTDTPTPALAAPSAGQGMAYDYHYLHEEFQQVNVSASGTVKTADGQEISFSIDLEMARYYREESSVSLRSGDAVRQDPLVLNFDGPAALLSDRRFEFDLFGNGRKHSLPLLQGNRGFLAFDRNGNGKIDSGKELFGPKTNSGFGELAALDNDGNGWIDEGDDAFDQLKVWQPGEQGLGALLGLKSAQVGAIALPHVASPFDLRGRNNSDLGSIAATGFFLGENGRPGTVQEVNLTV
jgi:hypothetical protein